MDVEEIDEIGVMTFLDDYEVHGVCICKFFSRNFIKILPVLLVKFARLFLCSKIHRLETTTFCENMYGMGNYHFCLTQIEIQQSLHHAGEVPFDS